MIFSSSKIGHNFSNKVVQKLTEEKNVFKKIDKLIFFKEFFLENFIDYFESTILALFEELSFIVFTKYNDFLWSFWFFPKILLFRTHHLSNFTNEMTCMYLGVCWHVIADVSSSYYLLQTWLKMHFLYTGFQTHFAHKSLYGFGVSKCDKIQSSKIQTYFSLVWFLPNLSAPAL